MICLSYSSRLFFIGDNIKYLPSVVYVLLSLIYSSISIMFMMAFKVETQIELKDERKNNVRWERERSLVHVLCSNYM